MKQFYFKLLLLSLSCINMLCAYSHDIEVDNIYYNIIGDEASVTYYGNDQYSHKYTGNIVIPSTIVVNSKPYRVTAIGNYAFYGCNITIVQMPNSLKIIGDRAFAYTSLSSLNIPNSVVEIGGEAFDHCGGLVSVVIPNSVHVIKESAFSSCI